MIQQLTEIIIQAIQQDGAKSVFLGAIIEQLAGVLIPSPIIPMSAGFLLIPKDLTVAEALLAIIQKVALAYTLGAVLGTMVFYLAAFWGGRAIVGKLGKIIGISLKHVDKFRTKFSRGFKDEVLIFLLLVLPVTSVSLVSAACGLIGIPVLEFLLVVAAGIFLRSIFLGWLGWQTGEAFTLLASGIDRIGSLFSLAIIGFVFIALAFLYLKRQKFLRD